MAITDYASLKDAVKSYAARNDTVFTDQFDTFLADAERRIYDGYGKNIPPVRLQQMETVATLAFVGGEAALPDDYLQLKDVSNPENNGSALTYLPPQAMHGHGSGSPVYYTTIGTDIKISPSYGGNIVIHYIAKFPAITAENSDNYLLINYPNIYLWAMLIEAFAFLRDTEEETKATQRYQAVISAIKTATRDKTYSGNTGRPLVRGGFSGGFDQQ